MKYPFLLPLLIFLPFLLFAQPEHRIAVGSKSIEFEEIDRLIIIGHDEKDIKITRKGANREVDERMKGMRKISADGKVDNTGFGLSAQGFSDKVIIGQVGKSNGTVMVYVPNTSVVKVTQSTYRGKDLDVDNFKGELDVSMMYNDANLSNAYGPLAINTVYGGIIATFSAGPPKEDIRLHSTYSSIDLTLPKSTAANVRLSTSYGSMYTDFDMDVKANMPEGTRSGQGSRNREESCNCPDDKSEGLTGTINGGGKLISLRATYKDIYLRKL